MRVDILGLINAQTLRQLSRALLITRRARETRIDSTATPKLFRDRRTGKPKRGSLTSASLDSLGATMADTGKIKEMKDREERCERARTRVSLSRHRNSDTISERYPRPSMESST